MKTKQLLLTLAFVSTIALKVDAQSIPNGNFETWTAITYEIPQNYVWTSNSDAFRNNLPFPVLKSTDAFHGNYSVQMTTQIGNGDSLPGIFVNVDPKNGDPSTWNGGFAYSQKPSGMRGYYKSAIASPDTGFVMAFFYKAGVMIGQYGFYFYGTHSTYTLFSFNFSPALPQNPDTVIFGAGSSNFNSNMRNGSMLKLDSLSFTGVTSQPALFNGDFETWQSTTIDKPTNWFLDGHGNNYTGGAFKTSDAKKGSNAIELITYVGEQNNIPRASGGSISTGYYVCPGDTGNCFQVGGYPFSNQADTLAFWYKYAPSNNGTGEVNLRFKKNGSDIGWAGTNLFASPYYQYKEIPFNVGQVPDSVIVNVGSSAWQDSLFSHVGSNLKIDEMHFKSQPLTTDIFNYENENAVSIYPNPVQDILSVQFEKNLSDIIHSFIYDATGRQAEINGLSRNANSMRIDVSNLSSGIYFYEIRTAEGIIRNKFVKQ